MLWKRIFAVCRGLCQRSDYQAKNGRSRPGVRGVPLTLIEPYENLARFAKEAIDEIVRFAIMDNSAEARRNPAPPFNHDETYWPRKQTILSEPLAQKRYIRKWKP